MRRILRMTAALIGLGLAGCAHGPSLQSRLAGYIGAPESLLVARLGVPQRQITVNGVSYLAYLLRYDTQAMPLGPAPWWGPGWGPAWGPVAVQSWACEATFAVREGKVQGFTLRGNDCD